MKHRVWMIGMAVMMASPALAAEPRPYPAPLVDLSPAPLSPSVLTEGKKEDPAVLLLRAAEREKVSATDGFDALLTRQKARDAALMELLGPDTALTRAVAAALKKEYGSFLTNNVDAKSADAIALQMVQSIFLNRRDDLASTQNLYADPAWQKAIRARLAKGEVPKLNVSLPAEKRTELSNTALYIHTPGNAEGKMEPAVHLILTALAQQIGHAGLVNVTREGSPIHAQFLASISKALPNDPAAKAWLSDWLYLRAGRAAAVVEDFRPDGELMQDAVAQSEAKRRSRLKNPPAITHQP